MLAAVLLSTPRLLLQPLERDHAPDLFRVYSDPHTMRWWHHLPHQNSDETLQMINGMLRGSAPAWAVVLKEGGRAIGVVNYIDAAVPGLGYIIGAENWRQGYGSEAVAAALDFGFAAMRLNRIELWIHSQNIASQKLAAKMGFRARGQFYQRYTHFSAPHETLIFGLRADEYEWASGEQVTASAREVPVYSVAPAISVANVAAAIAFYRDSLGFQLEYQEGYPPKFAIVSRGEWTSERARMHIVYAEHPTAGTLYFRIGAAVDALYEEFRERGVLIESLPQNTWYGTREFTVLDPDGWTLRFSGGV